MPRLERIATLRSLQSEFAGQPPDRWLSAAEFDQFQTIRSQHYAGQWLSGRWAEKRLLAKLLHLPSADIARLHIQSRDGRDRGCRPRVYWNGQLQGWSITISHCGDWLYAAASVSNRVRLGADVTTSAALPESFLKTWFSVSEQSWCRFASTRTLAHVVWSLKEAIYKATNAGESFTPRLIDLAALGLLPERLRRACQIKRPCQIAAGKLRVTVRPWTGGVATLAEAF